MAQFPLFDDINESSKLHVTSFPASMPQLWAQTLNSTVNGIDALPESDLDAFLSSAGQSSISSTISQLGFMPTADEYDDASFNDIAQPEQHLLTATNHSVRSVIRPASRLTIVGEDDDAKLPTINGPKWKRHNREGSIYGNNKVGRRGKQACDQCRKRKSKCVFTSPESRCEFCRCRNLSEPCIKRWGPKTEARSVLSPSRPVSIYDHSIRSEEVMCLQYLYFGTHVFFCGSVRLDIVARMFARIHGPLIAHCGIRHMIIAQMHSQSTVVESVAAEHAQYAFQALSKKLASPTQVDEDDLFVSYFLAMWSNSQYDFSAMKVHMKGVVAIMHHLRQKLGKSFTTSPLAPFWALIRDEIVWKATEMFGDSSASRFSQEFRGILGPKTIQQRQRYEDELRKSIRPEFRGFDEYRVLFNTDSADILSAMPTIINQGKSQNNSKQDPYAESILVDGHILQCSIQQQREESGLELQLNVLQSGKYVTSEWTQYAILHHIMNLITYYTVQLANIALEAPSLQQGLRSSDGMISSMSLVSVYRRARSFVLAGIKDARAIPHSDGYNYGWQEHLNRMCREILKALLNAAPGDCGVIEVLASLEAFAGDFERFQEIIVR